MNHKSQQRNKNILANMLIYNLWAWVCQILYKQKNWWFLGWKHNESDREFGNEKSPLQSEYGKHRIYVKHIELN